MQSFILLSSDPNAVKTYIDELIKKEAVSQFDVSEITQEEEAKGKKAAKKSLGIETIKTIQQTIYLTPVQGKKKLLIIKDANLLTTEAQNALLKFLEEPPAHMIILLVTETLQALLPTIQSRCFLINLTGNKQQENLSDSDNELFRTLSPKTILQLAEKKGKTKEEASLWSREMILQIEQELHVQTNPETIQQYSNILKKLTKIYQTVSSTNISPRMTIESILLNI